MNQFSTSAIPTFAGKLQVRIQDIRHLAIRFDAMLLSTDGSRSLTRNHFKGPRETCRYVGMYYRPIEEYST